MEAMKRYATMLLVFILANATTWYLLEYRHGAPTWAANGFGLLLGTLWCVSLLGEGKAKP